MKKVLKTVLDVLIVALFLTAVVLLISVLTQQKSGIPGAFGYSMASVQTNSMSGTIEPGDMVIGKICDENTEFSVGDIITFRKAVDGKLITVTHRITDIRIIDGNRFYETQGDNREFDYDGEKDVCFTPDEGLRAAGDIVSKHVLTLKGVGRAVDFLKTPVGFIVCLVLPLLVYIIYEISVIVSAVVAYRKKQIIGEYLAAQSRENTPVSGS